jgi:hypothetical protein
VPKLSRSAQEIQGAYRGVYSSRYRRTADQLELARIAAVLRCAARCARNVHPARPSTEWGEGWTEGAKDVSQGLDALATELERVPANPVTESSSGLSQLAWSVLEAGYKAPDSGDITRHSLVDALVALTFNADWESADPKFIVLGVAEELAGRRL